MYEYAMLRAIQQQMEGSHVEIRPLESLLWLISLPFVLLGWLVGFAWRSVLWCVAAVVVGYQSGLNGDEDRRKLIYFSRSKPNISDLSKHRQIRLFPRICASGFIYFRQVVAVVMGSKLPMIRFRIMGGLQLPIRAMFGYAKQWSRSVSRWPLSPLAWYLETA